MAQYARPDADDTDGNWTDKSGGGTLYTSIDETGSADDDTTYIKVADSDGSNSSCIVRLSDISAPSAGNAYLKVRAKRIAGSGGSTPPTLTLELVEGSGNTSRVSNTKSLSTSWGDLSHTFSGLDVSVSDWADLKFKLTMVAGDGAGMGGGDWVYVSQVWLETNDASSDPRKQSLTMTDPSMGIQGLGNNFSLE